MSSSGGYGASVPLDLPTARGGLPIPVQITYGERGVGAAGRGWDVPLSFIRRDTTVAHRRPVAATAVAPKARDQVSLVLDGRRIDLVRTATAWVPRQDAPGIEVREQSDGTWLMFDGQGRRFLFAPVSSALNGTGLWLLQDVTGPGGSKVHLDYSITTPSLPNATALAIDLTGVSYNPHPTIANCYKHAVALSYDSPASSPLSISMLGDKILARFHKLTSVDVSSKESCTSASVRLRRYQLSYGVDADTKLPRLQSVQMLGREGTPEASTPLPIAGYSYASATNGGALVYSPGQNFGLESAGRTRNDPPVDPVFGNRSLVDQMLLDVSGDGRPDFLSFTSGSAMTVRRNLSRVDTVLFGAPVTLSGDDMSARAPEVRTTKRTNTGTTHHDYSMVWRQMIDVNGDGRVDMIDTIENPGNWQVYLNTPDPSDPQRVRWRRRSYPIAPLVQYLRARGYTVDSNFLPLSRQISLGESHRISCWAFNGFEWTQLSEEDANQLPSACHGFTGPLRGMHMTDWELKDINGDGYPDLVFNSSPILPKWQVVSDERETSSGFATLVEIQSLEPKAGNNNKIEAVFNVLGTRLSDGATPYSTPVTLRTNEPCGVAQSISDSFSLPLKTQCALMDVNGDGIVDRVNGTAVMLGTGTLATNGFFTAGAILTLPGPLATEGRGSNPCPSGPAPPQFPPLEFRSSQLTGLRDLTGDGIPDYLASDGMGPWSVSIGTGTGFATAIPISGVDFDLTEASTDCVGTSTTIAGVFDVDGDGHPDVVTGGGVYRLNGSDGAPGAPAAGRLIQMDNGYGATTKMTYRSAKADRGLHQVPFAEIVIDSVETVGAKGLGGSLSATRYAYAGAELVFSPALDAFQFPGYRRQIVMPAPVGQPAGVATITVTDSYAPVSAVDPYGLSAAALSKQERYNQHLRFGRVRDVTVLSGDFGTEAVPSDPSRLLDLDVYSDSRRIAATHYDWDARLLATATDPEGPERCTEMVFPYHHSDSDAFAMTKPSYDPCTAHGFAFASSVQSWRGDAAPPATANVESRFEVRTIDELGRPLTTANLNDLHRPELNVCVTTKYAEPEGSNERQLHAVESQTVTNCGSGAAEKILSSGRWEYDELAVGHVSSGFPTSYTIERRDDAGGVLRTIRQFDADFDAQGNPISVTTAREDGASRTVSVTYDPFGLAPISFTTTATNVPTTQSKITLDQVTMNVLSTTDPNGAQSGATFDGFDRVVLSTVTPAGGAIGAMAVARYFGFSGSDSEGRRVELTTFTDSVPLASAFTTAGRSAKVFLDELGRERRTEVALGTDYSNQKLIVGHRSYDGLGRVVFAADPYPSTQSFATAYGTTAFFNVDGTPHCMVRGNGQLPSTLVPSDKSQSVATNEAQELYPTCFLRSFQNHTEAMRVQDAASLLAGSPQSGVTKWSYANAIGQVLERSTWQGASRLEYATFTYDRLGRRTGMTRYQDANAGTKPVTSSWRYDSLGQLLQLDEPDSVPQLNTYSDWGELKAVTRYPSWPSTSQVRRVVKTYDALGRVLHGEEQSNGITDPETVNDYFYDQPVNVAPQVTPTFMLGRLALATSPTGSESLSYDGLGRINARVFTDSGSRVYVEKHKLHTDGTPESLDLLLPDTSYATERVSYAQDSAGRTKSVKYGVGATQDTLYDAPVIDAFGRVRQAKYGQADYAASYADVGRRLLAQVKVSSPTGSRDFTYQGFDPVGRERSRVEVKNGASTGAATTWSYDALGRLSSALTTSGSTTTLNQQLTYDPLGNLQTLANLAGGGGTTSTALTYLDTDRDRICRIKYGTDTGTACNVTYDEVGSILTQATPTGQRQYSYLIDGSVRTISDSQGSTAHFRYDAFGAVQELDLTTPVSQDGRRDRHYGGLISERMENGAQVLLRQIPGPDGFLATRHGSAGSWTFTFGEPRGNRFFTDQNGAFVQDVDYQPYGKATSTGAQPGTSQYSSEQWNGGDLLAAFGVSQLGARLYDPAMGRFVSRDPLLIPRTAATTNPYAFAANDPVNHSDPSGLDPTPCNTNSDGGQCQDEGRGDLSASRWTTVSIGGGSFGWTFGTSIDTDFGSPSFGSRGPYYNGRGGGSSGSSGDSGTAGVSPVGAIATGFGSLPASSSASSANELAQVPFFRDYLLVMAALGYEGKLYWAGPSGLADDGKIATQTSRLQDDPSQGYEWNDNNFAEAMRGQRSLSSITNWSKMNCWELFMYAAYEAKLITERELRSLHEDAARSSNYSNYIAQKLNYNKAKVWRGGDAVPIGSLVFFSGLDHVALSTGQVRGGKHEIISLWQVPYRGSGPSRRFNSRVQVTTIEDLLAIKSMTVQYAPNPWR